MGISMFAKCPVCKGKGRVEKELPFGANPKAPNTRIDKAALLICPKCKGSGFVELI